MRTFDEILAIAIERKGGREAVLGALPPLKSARQLAAIPDDRWLAAMARGIFQAGISWKVVDAKWPEIEEAFDGFAIGPNAMMSDDRFDALMADRRVIRSAPKIRAIRDNAVFIGAVAREHGSFGRKIADWPGTDFAGLLEWLKQNGARLGGNTGPYMLRYMGKDGFTLSRDVIGRLVAEGVLDKAPTSKKAMAAMQAAFNQWAEESGQPLAVISRVLAQSIDS